jgi:hypothetical protein
MPSKLYTALETALLFADSAQTEDATMTLSALAAGAGRVSARYDRGAGSHAALYEWRIRWALTGTNVVGAALELFAFTSDGTNADGVIGTADAALASSLRDTTTPMGLAVVYQTTTNTVMVRSGYVYIAARYVSLGLWNATTLPLQTSTSVHGITLTPIPWESQ